MALLLFFVMFSVLGVQGQVTVAGAVTGNGTYATLGAAFTAIPAAQAGANITVTITGNTTEAATGATLVAGTWTSLTIAPSGGPWTISGAATAGTPLITFNGSDNVTVNGGGNLIFSNTTVSATTGTSTLKLVGDATNNTFNNLMILGSANGSTGSNTANVWISTGTTSGNDGNSFQSCKFGPAGSNLPGQLIVANGSATSNAIQNSGIIINNCEFYDYFQAGSASAAIYMSTGNTSWTVTNNKIYQTAARTITTAQTDYGIYMVNTGTTALGESFTVTGNTIGYTNNSGTGTMTYDAGATAGGFVGINFSASSSSTSTNNINSNTVSNIQWTSTAGSTITGISSTIANTATGAVLNLNGNTVRNINYINGTGTFIGLLAGYAPTTSVSSNTITNLSRSGAGVFYGINYSGTSSTTDTLNLNSVTNLTSTSTSSISAFYGIYSGSSSANEIWTNNTVDGLTSSATGAQTVMGIANLTSTSGNKTCQNNIVKNISLPSTSTGTLAGIRIAYIGALNDISGNTVSGLSGGTSLIGINFGSSSVAASAVTNVYKNKIYGLSSSVASPTVYGINVPAGVTNNIYNNIIGGLTAASASGTDVIRGISITSTTATSTHKVYYNTVYLNGTSSGADFGSSGIYHVYSATATTSALDMRNNIIVNASGANGTGLAVAFRRSSATDLANYATTSNNNLFFGTSGVYNNGTTTYAFGPFQSLVSTRETASKSQNPTFANISNGALSTYLNFADGAINLAGGNAQVISGYTTDYSGASRDGSAPDMGAFEFNQGTISAPTITGFTTAFSPSAPIYLCSTGGSVVTITGTGLDTVSSVLFNGGSGVNLAGTITAQTATSLTVTSPAGVVDGIIRVTNPGGSADSSSAFTTADPPTVGVSSAATICSGSSTTLTATGANTYAWSPSLGLNGTTTASVTASPTTTTTYTVVGTTTAGCSANNTVTVNVNAAPPAITAGASSTTPCLGALVNLTSTSGNINSTVNEGFETFPPSGWTFTNEGSGNAWTSTTTYFRTGTRALYYSYNSSNAADAWAYTPAQSLIAGVTYTVSYWYRGNGTTYPENLKLTVGTGLTKASQTTTLATQSNITTTTFTQVSVTYTPSVSGVYYFALNCFSAANMNYLAVDDFSIASSLPASYSWTSSPEGFTSSVQNPTGLNVTQPTTFTVVATANGCSKSSSVTVTPNALPTISTNGTSTICAGGAGASLTATGGVSYLWSPTTGLSFADVANPTATPSATTTYTVTGTDANGCKNTATATVTVNTPVAITTQPANQTAVENSSASFSVVATGSGLTYQWQTYNGSTWDNISGETAATYTIASAPSSLNNSQYRVIVSGAAPCGSVTSSAVTLLVGSVAITTQPADQTICSNGSATFSIVATGTVTSYQWQYQGRDVNNDIIWIDLSGETNSSLILTGQTSSSSGIIVRCSLNNGELNSNPATLTVYDAVVIGTQPSSQTVCSNAASVTFTSAATGSGVSYLWQVSTNGGSTWTNISGATAAAYTINTPGVGLNNNQYRVVVSGTAPCAAVTSNAATLTVTDVAVAASSTSICIGQSVTLSATYTGVPNTTNSSWVCATTGSGATTAVSGDSAVVTPTAAGTYVYTFTTNGSCSFTRTVSVTVNALPVISAVTATPATVCSGANISLVSASVTNANGTVALGAGASTSGSVAASVFPGSWGGAKSQYLIKASELTALGLTAGNITSIAFEPTSSGQTYQGFFVSIGATTDNVLTATFLPNGTQVYAGTLADNGFTPVANTVNTLAFGTGSGSASSFAWNGTSNIVVTFSWSRVPSASTSTSSTMKYDTASFTCTTYKQADSQTPAAMLAQTTGTTSTSRPKFTFGGVVATNLASTYTWSWNTTPAVTTATGTTSVVNTSGAAVSQTFTATATNVAGCSTSLSTSAVTINSTIPTPTATDGTQCGTGTPTCSVTGSGRPGNTFRWYTVSTNGTALSGQTGSTLVAPYTIAATTTFYVAEFDGLCEGPRVAVTQTVTTPFAFALSASTATNCSGSNSLTPVTITTNGGYDTFTWSNPATVSGNSSTGWTFSPTATTTYTLTATGGGCSTTANVVVTPTALPVVTVAASPAAICVGASSTLTATTNTVAAGTVKVGTSTTTNTSSTGYPTAFGDYWYQDWQQYVFTAAELNALGLTAGNITSLTFDISALPSSTSISDYNVKIGSTSNSTLSGFTTTGLTNVYGPASYTPTVGANTITFSTPYFWNGTSNIIVDIRETGLYGSANATTNYTTTTGNTVVYAYASTSNSSFWTSSPTATTSTSRPNITFAGQKVTQSAGTLAYTWNGSSTTGNVLTASPTTTTTYTVYGLNGTTGCTGTATATVTVYAPPTAPSVTNAIQCGTRVPLVSVADTNGYTTPTFKWYADNLTTTALQTSTSTTFTGSISTTTTFYVSVVSPGGCESPRTAVTTTVVAPAALTVTPDTTVCAAGSATLTASGAVSYTWSPALGLNGTTGASVVATPSATTTYSVTGVDTNGCTTAAATVKVTVAPYPTAVTITPGAASVCTNSVMSLTASGGTIGGSGTATFGTDNAATKINTTAVPYRTGAGTNGQPKNQYLVLASELTAAGMTAGNITSLTFVTTSATGVMSNMSFRMANTSASVLTSTLLTPAFTNVLTLASYTPVVGDNTHAFTTPFAWDGTSNILVETCGTVTSGSGCTMATTTTAAVTTVGGGASTTGCNDTTGTTISNARPVMKLGYTSVVPTVITWSPTTDLYTDALGTTAYTGGGATVVYTKPSMERTYTATASNGACATPATTTVTPESLPTFAINGTTTICKGQSTALTATGAGLTYSWSPALGLNGTTGASVTATPMVTTTYTVEATNASGCKSIQMITVTVSDPGAILSGTTSQLGIPGGTTTFLVETASGATYTYQWQYRTSASGTWSDLSDDSYHSGVTTATLTLSDIQESWNEYQYQCLVTGASPCATLTPIVATLTISSTGIETQPQNVTVCAPGSTSFSIVTNGDEPYGIQWQMSTDNGVTFIDVAEGTDTVTGLTFSGVDTTTLGVSGVTFANNGIKFLCMLNYYLLSDSATLTVKQPVDASNPANQTVCSSGGTATFSTTATGSDLAYQWQFSTNGGSSWGSYTGTGATTASISIVNPALGLNGTQYRVVVSGNAACSSVTTAAATLFINNPTITAGPVAATVLRGNTAAFTVAASAATSYQWQRSATLNGAYVDVVDGTPASVSYSGATTATLSVVTTEAAAISSANYYRCVVTNNGCSVTSVGAQLTINGYCTPSVATTTTSYFDRVALNGATSFDNSGSGFSANGYGNFTSSFSASQVLGNSVTYTTTLAGTTVGVAIWVDWNRNGTFETTERVANTTSYVSTFAGSFTVPMTATVGTTRMRIMMDYNNSNPANPCTQGTRAETEDYTFEVLPQPVCTSESYVAGTASAVSTSLCYGNTASLSLNGFTTGIAGLTYQWYYSANGVDFSPVSGATSTTFTTGSLTANAYYYCVTSCSAGGSLTSNTVAVTIANPLLTGTTPAGRCGTGTVTLGATANAGSTVNWYAAATGGAMLGSGTSFTTPSIAATTTYYAEAFIGSMGTAARTAPASTDSDWWTNYGLVFDTSSNITLNSVVVYPVNTTPAAMTIKLLNSSGTQVPGTSDVVFTPVSATGSTPQTVNLNYAIPAGTGYRLVVSSGMSTSNKLVQETTGFTYPMINGPVSVTSNWSSSSTSLTYYNWFYNWSVTSGCSSSRTAVVATVDALPTATISYAGSPYCSTATTGTVTRTGTAGGAYSSTAGLTIDPSTGTIDVAASTPGTYTVTYSMNGTTYCDAQRATTTVVINQALTSGFAYDFATYCTNQGVITPTVSGTAGVFTASPAGLSINATTGAITLASSAAGTYTVTNTVSVAGCANSVSTFQVTVNAAVAITTQPVSVSKLPGDNASFSVAATGTGLTYQWEVNTGSGWTALSGETAATLSLTAVTAEMNGYQYRVVVSGAASCTPVSSSAATLTVSTAAIATQPVNFTACSEGANTATFSVTTTGIVDTYQWQVSTNGTTWTDITNGGIYADATTATLSLSGLSLTNDQWQFRVVLNSAVYSNPATLTIKTAVAIATQPSSTTGCSGGSASFTVAATGSGLGYQWQVSTNGTTWNNVSGATSATLTLNSLTASMNGYQYKAIVSGASPCSALTSSVVTLTVNTAVAFTTQPASTTVCNGANATFSVTATGTAPTYQWQMSTNGTTYNNLSGETAASLTVAAVTMGMNGYSYRVVVSGAAPCGTVTSNAAVLTVNQPAAPVITPASATVCLGSVQTLTATSASLPQPGIIGTGTVSNTTTTPFRGFYGGIKVQFLYTAAELTALGYSNGTVITSLGMDITSFTSPYTFNGFTIGMKNTNTSALTATLETGLTTVKNSSNYTLSGTAPFTVTLPLDTNFTWNGTSNLVIEFCFNNNNGGGVSGNSANVRSTTVTGSTVYYSADSTPGVCSSATGTTSTTRANMRFGVSGGSITWTPTTDLYTNVGATTAYTGGNATTVYTKPTTSRTYTVTATNSLGCTNSSTVAVTVPASSTLGSITQPLITCSGAQTTFNLTGLLPNSTSTINYTINSVAQTAITGVVADASGNASFTVALSAVNNGRTLAITSITRTDLTPACATAITANNTVVIAVQPLVTYYADADGDGFGNNAVTQITCQGQPAGYVTNNTDCDDTDNTKHATFNFYVDADGDGYGAGAPVALCAVNGTTPPTAGYVTNNTDCNDADATKYASYSFYADADGDGYGAGSLVSVCAVNATTPPSGYSLNGTDCDDADATKWRSTTLYVDADADGYDNGTATVCWGATVPTGYSQTTLGTDCNDANASATVPVTNTSTVTACGSYVWSVNGNTYTSSGTYTSVVNSCLTEVLHLTISCSSVVTITANIEGYYDAGTHAMRPVLMNQGVGSSSTDVDHITVELHDASTYALVATTTAMLQTNGTAVATYSTAPSGSFYVVVKHRNSLETWSATPVAVGPTPASYNFTDAASKAYGNNMKMLETGVYGFYSGDINQDGFIEGTDYDSLNTDTANSEIGFFSTDLNGDGFVDGLDYDSINTNVADSVIINRP